MTSDTTSLLAEFKQKIDNCTSSAEFEALELELFGRKQGVLTLAMKELKNVDPDKRKELGLKLNELKNNLTDYMVSARKKNTGATETEELDVTLELPVKRHGHLHLIPELINTVEDIFGRMGFDTAYGPEIESEDNNFNLLNIPADHPARDAQDTFWIKGAKAPSVLRTHTSPVQIRYMQSHKPPFRMICPGKVYRKDADATHSPMFHQIEGLMIGTDVSLADMKGIMTQAFRDIVSNDLEFRFRTSFFPFVEPGLEYDFRWRGDDEDSREGAWLEIGGCGMVHPNVLRNVDIDPDAYQGFAFGFGVERLLMIKHQIPDLRIMYQGDLRFLEQF